jgi:hypothetical protein
VGPRAGLDTEVRGKNHFASDGNRSSIAWSSSPEPDTILTELPGSQYEWQERGNCVLGLLFKLEYGIVLFL